MPMYANLNNLASPVTHAHYTIFTISFQLHNFVQHREMGIFLYKFQNLMILSIIDHKEAGSKRMFQPKQVFLAKRRKDGEF